MATLPHIGNNIYIMRSNNGDTENDIPAIQNAVVFDIDSGRIYHYSGNAPNIASFGSRTDQLFLTWQIQMTLTNHGTVYKDIYPALFDGLPLGLDTSGFTELGIVVAWNKNIGATGRHDLRIVNAANETQVLVHSEQIPDGMVTGTRRYYNIAIPTEFKNFRGEVKLQGKSDVGTDDPIFYGLWVYLMR